MQFIRGRLQKKLYDGTSCTGADGDVNRTLTSSRPCLSDSIVMVGGRPLFITDEYTITGSFTITFLINIDNTDRIMVIA